MQWRRRRAWYLGLLGIAAALTLVAAAVALGAAGEGAWGRWRQAMFLFAAGLATMTVLVARSTHRRTGEEYVSTGMVVLTAVVAGVLALMFAAGSAFIGDVRAAAAAMPVAAVAAVAAAVVLVRIRRARARVLPPFRRLTPEAFKSDVDPPAYPEPATDDGEAAAEEARPSGMLDRFLRALAIRR